MACRAEGQGTQDGAQRRSACQGARTRRASRSFSRSAAMGTIAASAPETRRAAPRDRAQSRPRCNRPRPAAPSGGATGAWLPAAARRAGRPRSGSPSAGRGRSSPPDRARRGRSAFLTMALTLCPSRAELPIAPQRSIARNTGPSEIPAASSQAFKATTGRAMASTRSSSSRVAVLVRPRRRARTGSLGSEASSGFAGIGGRSTRSSNLRRAISERRRPPEAKARSRRPRHAGRRARRRRTLR